jgi:RNA polymerase sigma-54 factor
MGSFSPGLRLTHSVKLLPVHQIRLMAILRFSSTALVQHLAEQSYANPVLDVQSRPVCPRCGRALDRTGCRPCRIARNNFQFDGRQSSRNDDENDPAERIEQPGSALSSLLRQCGELPLTPAERGIGEYLLGELDDRGLLVGTVSEHAAALRTDAAVVERVRRHLLQLDPVGIAATSVRECLTIKVKTFAADKPWAPAALKLLEQEWESVFGELDFARAARALRLPQAQLLDVLRELAGLSPYPLQALRDDERDALPAVPDVRFEIIGTGPSAIALVEVLEQERTAIHVNRNYLKTGADETTGLLRSRLADYRREAMFIQKAVERRWSTLERVCLAIFDAQRAFFTGGRYCPTTLVPLTREAIAERLRMHPSTIGRAIEEKYAALPNGRVVPLRYFFDQNVPIRALLRNQTAAEERAASDGDLCDFLARRGWTMSRRAAAYHRDAANILPKKLRNRERLLHRHRDAC